MAAFFSSHRISLRALATSFVPETAAATPEQWVELERIIERALAARPARLRRQLGLLIRVLEGLARIRYGASLAGLDPVRRSALLESLARSPLLLLRRGIWGLRTLIMMGWYTQAEVAAAIGYRACPAGWSARR